MNGVPEGHEPGPASPSPWQGLLPYFEEDQEKFFGRGEETAELLRLVRRKVLTVLFGRSGTGKTSLVRAGLFPKLREEDFLPVWIRLDHSGAVPYDAQIVKALEGATRCAKLEVESFNPTVTAGPESAWEFLHRVMFWNERNRPITPVLVFDQFEEIFTLGDRHVEVGEWIESMADLVENYVPRSIRMRVEAGEIKLPPEYSAQRYKVMISLREDFVARLDRLRIPMPSVMHNRFSLERMNGSQALEVVLRPAGARVDPEVAREIVCFVAAANHDEISPGSNPNAAPEEDDFARLQIEPALLSLVCSELDLQRRKQGREQITREQVRSSSDRILEDFYERCMAGLSPSDRAFLEDRLVTGSGFRTAVPTEEAIHSGLSAGDIETLTDRRLLRQEDRLGIPHIELTHDVLTKVVTRSRNSRREHESIEATRKQDKAIAKEREKARQIRRAWRARWIATAVAIVFATLSIFTWRSAKRSDALKIIADKARQTSDAAKHTSDMARRTSEIRALALRATNTGARDPELSLLLAIEAAMLAFQESGGDEDLLREIEQALRYSTRESLIRMRFGGHAAAVYSVDFSPDGKWLLTSTANGEGTAKIWNVADGTLAAVLDPTGFPGSDGEKTTVSCARFSPNGSRIATSTYRNGANVYLWDATFLGAKSTDSPPTLTHPLGAFSGHQGWVTSLAFSPDGRRIASGGYDKTVRIWDSVTFTEVAPPLTGHTARIRKLVFDKDGQKILTASDDGTAILWNLPSAETPVPSRLVFDPSAGLPPGSRQTLHSADLSPDGNFVATGDNSFSLRIWDARSGAQLAAVQQVDAVMDVAFIDETHVVSGCNDAAVRFWSMRNSISDDSATSPPASGSAWFLKLISEKRGHTGWIREVAVSPDKRSIASGGNDPSVRQWALPPGGEAAVLVNPESPFWSADLRVSNDPTSGVERRVVFAGTKGGEIRAIDTSNDLPLKNWGNPKPPKFSHSSQIRSIALSPDGSRLVTTSQDQTAIVWDAGTGTALYQWTGHQGENGGTVYQGRFSPDGKRIVTASYDGTAQVWSAGETRPDAAPDLILFPADGTFADSDLTDVAGLARRWFEHPDPPSAFLWDRLSPENRTTIESNLAAATGESSKTLLRILRQAFNQAVSTLDLKSEPAFAAVPRQAKSRWLESGTNPRERMLRNRFLLTDAFPGWLKSTLPSVYDARFSSDGSMIVTADFEARTASLWDARDGRRLRVFPAAKSDIEGHRDNVVSAAFHPDGSRVITASTDGFCRIWETQTGKLLASIPHRVAVRSAEYCPDGKSILTSAADGIARIWSLPSMHLRCELEGHSQTTPEAKFSSDGRYILTTSRDGTVRISYALPWDLYGLAVTRITRKLTKEERGQYGVNRPLTAIEEEYYRQK